MVELGSREGGCELRIAPDGEVPLPEWQGLSAWVAALGGRIESGRGAGWLRVLLAAELVFAVLVAGGLWLLREQALAACSVERIEAIARGQAPA